MKGVSLAINVIVVFLIGLIVFSVVIVFLMNQISQGEIKIDIEKTLHDQCSKYKKAGCPTPQSNEWGNLKEACFKANLCIDQNTLCPQCANYCGCP